MRYKHKKIILHSTFPIRAYISFKIGKIVFEKSNHFFDLYVVIFILFLLSWEIEALYYLIKKLLSKLKRKKRHKVIYVSPRLKKRRKKRKITYTMDWFREEYRAKKNKIDRAYVKTKRILERIKERENKIKEMEDAIRKFKSKREVREDLKKELIYKRWEKEIEELERKGYYEVTGNLHKGKLRGRHILQAMYKDLKRLGYENVKLNLNKNRIYLE